MLNRSAILLALFASATAFAEPPAPAAPTAPAAAAPAHPETTPTPRPDAKGWSDRNKQLAANAAKGAEVAFIGDSITQGWETGGKAAWAEHFAAHWKCVNLGVSGDTTENVLWRLTEGGNLGGGKLTPKVFVILIGTNNAGRRSDTPEQILGGVKAVVDTLQKASPQSKIILTAILPRNRTKPEREILVTQIVRDANPLLKAFAAERNLVWFDINDKLAPGGVVSKAIFPDGLHPNAAGYKIWAAALEPVIAETVK